MPAARVTYTWVPNPLVFRDAILSVEAALRDPMLPLLAAKEYVQEDVALNFYKEQSPEGEPWEPWAESYQDYANNYPNVGILRQDEDLFDAATSEDAYVVSNDTLFFENSGLPSVGWGHQEGVPERRTKGGASNPLPARPFLGLSPQAEAVIFNVFAGWFDKSIDLFRTVTGRIGRRHAAMGYYAPKRYGFVSRTIPMPGLRR